MAEQRGLPVAGYQPQSEARITVVNQSKMVEEAALRLLDELAKMDVDKRWLAVGRTQIEQGFMAVNRAVFRPGRVSLPEDEAKA